MDSSGLLYMTKNNMYNDLACMYKLLRRVDGGLKIMICYISRYLREFGKSIVQIEDSDTHVAVNCVQVGYVLMHFNELLILTRYLV